MAYDEALSARIRPILQLEPGMDEKTMFGGIAFLINGNTARGVHADNLIVRLDPDDYDQALRQPGASVFDLTGRPMNGWVMVDSFALEDDADLERWVRQGMEFARSLPPKEPLATLRFFTSRRTREQRLNVVQPNEQPPA